MTVKYMLVLITILFFFSNAFGVNVAEDEIKKSRRVVFENYKGGVKGVSVKELIDAGRSLASIMEDKTVKKYLQYSVVRVLPSEELFGADIIYISDQSKIKHINAIRFILAGYFSQKFGYKYGQAYTLAVFTTYYNAIHRGDLDYFSKKYVGDLFAFTTENIGISTKYYEWAGKTELIIPTKVSILGEKPNLGEIGKEDVIRELKKQDDLGLDERKEMVDIRKKELEEERGEIEKKEKELQEKREELEKRKEEISRKEEELKAKEDVSKGEISKIEEEKRKISEEEKSLEAEEERLEKAKEEVKKEEEEIKKEEERIKKDEELLERKDDLAKKEEELKKKEEELKKKEEEVASQEKGNRIIVGDKMYYLKKLGFRPEGHYDNRMFLIDINDMKIMKQSSFTNICGFKYYVYGEGVVVIGNTGSHSDKHFLVLLDVNTIDPLIVGKDDIFWRSFIEFNNDFLYAITIVNNKYYLGKFDKKLNRVGISDVEVHPDTFITFYKGKIFINDKDKNIIVLDEATLKKVDQVK